MGKSRPARKVLLNTGGLGYVVRCVVPVRCASAWHALGRQTRGFTTRAKYAACSFDVVRRPPTYWFTFHLQMSVHRHHCHIYPEAAATLHYTPSLHRAPSTLQHPISSVRPYTAIPSFRPLLPFSHSTVHRSVNIWNTSFPNTAGRHPLSALVESQKDRNPSRRASGMGC
jgi:hypothetical protein